MRAALRRCAGAGRLERFLAGLSGPELARLHHDWPLFARPDQWPPPDGPWTTWLAIGGRGAGKTRSGAEWVRARALGLWGEAPAGRIALVGETFADVRDVMIEGLSGLLAIHGRATRPLWHRTRGRLEWPNGAVAQIYSAEAPDGLRGPQFDAAWLDELAKWPNAEETWDMLQFALRLGAAPRQIVTTTPRPIPLLKRLMAEATSAVTRARTADNAANLAPAFLSAVVGRYAGTRLGRQELDGELIEEVPGALWTRAMIEAARVNGPTPVLARIVVAVDPPASSRPGADRCGIVAVGRDREGGFHVLADESAAGLSPAAWAARAVALHRRLGADAIVAEVNQGGEMVAAVLREAAPDIAVKPVRATRGKWLRAEPVAALYEAGRVRHAAPFPALEDEMCAFAPEGLGTGRSPDRLDALVWAITALMAGPAAPRVRSL